MKTYKGENMQMRRSIFLGRLVVPALVALFAISSFANAEASHPRIHPVRWKPSKSPGMKGVFAANSALAGIEREETENGIGPETIAFDAEGALYTGLRNGKVIRYSAWNSTPTVFAETGGRVLGLAFHPNGDLIIADADRGLLAIDRSGKVSVLADAYAGHKFLFVNDVTVSKSGTIYFTDSSTRWKLEQSESDFIEHGSTGRLFAYAPAADGHESCLRLVADHLDYPNGAALGPDEAYVAVAETTAYRISRIWLKGPHAGTRDVLVDALPGIPTGITFNGTDRFWFGMASPRIGILDSLAGRPGLRKLLPLIPAGLKPKPTKWAWAIGVDLNGKVVANLLDQSPTAFAGVTSVIESEGYLYLGGGFETSFQTAVARLKVPATEKGETP